VNPVMAVEPLAAEPTAESRIEQVSFGVAVLTIVRKDLLVELRRRETFLSQLVFGLLVVVLFDFAFDVRADQVRSLIPGMLWVTFVFAGVLSLNRAFSLEKDRGTLDGLLLAPVDRAAIYIGKLLSHLASMFTVEVILVAASTLFFGLTFDIVPLAAALILGTLGFSCVGTLFAAMASSTGAREVLLPVLLFPVSVPVLIAAVKATALSMGAGDPESHPWLGLIAAYDAIFLAVSFAVFEYILEE
jgi:heme exporter protein B